MKHLVILFILACSISQCSFQVPYITDAADQCNRINDETDRVRLSCGLTANRELRQKFCKSVVRLTGDVGTCIDKTDARTCDEWIAHNNSAFSNDIPECQIFATDWFE